MHIKRTSHIAPKFTLVKNAGLALVAMSSLAFVSSPANAASSQFSEMKITIQFHASELEVDGGTEMVYSKIKKKAKSACLSLRKTSEYQGETYDECVADLVNQLVLSADKSALINHHKIQQTAKLSQKFASN